MATISECRYRWLRVLDLNLSFVALGNVGNAPEPQHPNILHLADPKYPSGLFLGASLADARRYDLIGCYLLEFAETFS